MKTTGNSCFIDKGYRQGENLYGLYELVNGKVIGEFVCDEIIVAKCGNYGVLPKTKTMVDELDLLDYADEKTVYGWHISNLVIYDKPRELKEFSSGSSRLEFSNTEDGFPLNWSGMKRPPQSWCYVESE